MRLQNKILGLAAILVGLNAGMVSLIVQGQRLLIERKLDDTMVFFAQREASLIARDVQRMATVAKESLDRTLKNRLEVAQRLLDDGGAIALGPDPVHWKARNQYTQASQPVQLPRMYWGEQWLGQILRQDDPAPYVDEVVDLLGGTCTLFQRMNAEGDMLRVATNVPDTEGQRAIGTFIPAINPDGAPNPVVRTILAGQTYNGHAYVVNAWYETAYKPIYGADGITIIGMLYVGERELPSLRQAIRQLRVGKSGYVFVLGAQGAQRGRYLVSHQGQWDGAELLHGADIRQQQTVTSLIAAALRSAEDASDGTAPIAFDTYLWRNPGEPSARKKFAAITYFEPWDWVIGASYYEEDLDEIRRHLDSLFSDMITWLTAATLAVAVLAIWFSILISRGLSKPIANALESFQAIGKGDLNVRLKEQGDDEFAGLAKGFNQMLEELELSLAIRDALSHRIVQHMEENEALREEHRESDYDAHHDELTDLMNRRALDEMLPRFLDETVRTSTETALIYIDLDGFKEINDQFGHAAGDQVLRQTADRLRASVRESDAVFRLGGDEFLVVLSCSRGAARPQAGRVAADIVTSTAQPIAHESGPPLQVSASVGISLSPSDGVDVGTLLSAADAAMYRVKTSGKSGFAFYRDAWH